MNTPSLRTLILVGLVAIPVVDAAVIAYILQDPQVNPGIVGAIAAVVVPSAALAVWLWRLSRRLPPPDEGGPQAPPPPDRLDWSYVWHPLLLVVPVLAGIVGLGQSARNVDLAWGLVYALPISLVVLAAGVITGLLHHGVVRLVPVLRKAKARRQPADMAGANPRE